MTIYRQINKGPNRLLHYFLMVMPAGQLWEKLVRTGLPVLFALFVFAALVFHVQGPNDQTPFAKEGRLTLLEWDEDEPFGIAGEWEFYWDSLLNARQISEGRLSPILVDAPSRWNTYVMNGVSLPGKGKATYRIRVTGAKTGVRYGVRIQDMASVYRLYADDSLVTQNGSFGDTEFAPASDYRPQLAAFTPVNDSFDLILQIENNAFYTGGMWEPIIFGTYEKVFAFDKLISIAVASAAAGLVVMCLFFLIFFAVLRRERDMLIFPGIGFLVLMRFLMIGDVALTVIFSGMSIAFLNRIQFLTLPWTLFLLLYFVYCAYGNLVHKWQIITLLVCSVGLSLFFLFYPFAVITSTFTFVNFILLFVIIAITAQLTRAAWQGREGASLLLGAIFLILLLIFYEVVLSDRSLGYYLLTNLHFEYMLFVFAQVAVVALRYRRAQRLEIAHLKGQIRPHFIHNALTSIIHTSRNEPDHARELLLDFSSYLRSFYDYEQDELISFTQELELVRSYVALEQARFGEKLRVEYRIENENFFLPSLILQPLVENAFVHGLREKEDGGTVTVYTMRIKNGRVRVGVRDDGVGFSSKSASLRRGVGIENINRRLSRLYRTSLVYLKPEGGGCEVYLEIPCKEAAKHESMAD